MSEFANQKVVIIEDDQTFSAIASELLRKMGFDDVRRFSSAETALEQLGPDMGGIDVLLCDLHLPGKNGLEVLQDVRSRNKRVKFVLITGDATPENVKAAKGLRANMFITKPVVPKDFIARITAAVQGPAAKPPPK